MLRRTFILVLIFVLASLAVMAQESSEMPEDANACDEGGSMEGKCNIDFNGDGEVSDYEVTWAWTCGWYMIRYDAGIFAEVPVFCQSLLPAEVPSEGDGGDEGSSDYCAYAYDDGSFAIFYFDGSEWSYDHASKTDEDYPACGPDIPV